MVDVYQLQQVVLNLITNAEQAMADVDRDRHRLILRTHTLSDVIRIEVEDTGPGIPPKALHQIFNPFFTTKPTGKGTGLGLSISLGIVSEHGGRIWAEGKVGVGAQNGDCIALGLVIKGHQTQTSAFFPSIIGSQGVISAVSAVQGKTLPKYIEAPVLSVTTKLANAWLAGTSQPPAKLRADIMRRLKEAKSGNCPTK